MSEYTRTTRRCAFVDLRPELVTAIRQHCAWHGLDTAEADALICCETASQRDRAGLFGRLGGGRPAVQYCGVLVTPRWLVWAISDPVHGAAAVSARLADIEVTDYASTLIPDTGLDVFGFLTGAAERGQIFIGLGPEAAAHELRQVLCEAVERVGQPAR